MLERCARAALAAILSLSFLLYDAGFYAMLIDVCYAHYLLFFTLIISLMPPPLSMPLRHFDYYEMVFALLFRHFVIALCFAAPLILMALMLLALSLITPCCHDFRLITH